MKSSGKIFFLIREQDRTTVSVGHQQRHFFDPGKTLKPLYNKMH